MNWINALCSLYDNHNTEENSLVGDYKESVIPVKTGKKGGEQETRDSTLILLPESHTTVLAQIEVTIDDQGIFQRATKVDKNDALTIIPTTEKSAARTSGSEPHPLCDNLEYLDGDYDKYLVPSPKTGGKEISFRESYDEYISALEKWCNSTFAYPKTVAILKYLKNNSLIRDLSKDKILVVNEKGDKKEFSDKVKFQGNIRQDKAFVRFRVEPSQSVSTKDRFDGAYVDEVWKDKVLQKNYIEYYRFLRSGTPSQLCYLTGEKTPPATFHPSKIRNDSDRAKLFSSNDKENFTYRGRFENVGEAVSIGYETSQKVHNALKWIIRKQGYTKNGLCIVIWESQLRPLFLFWSDPVATMANPGMDVKASDEAEDFLSDIDDPPPVSGTQYIQAKKFNAAIDGYKSNLGDLTKSHTVILALDSATQGRLALTYFNDLASSRYLECIQRWHESCCWIHSHGNYKFEGMAALEDIALALYATTSKSGKRNLTGDSGIKASMMISTFNRLLPCILNNAKIPKDMVRLAIRRASSPLSYENASWEKILAVACSLVKKEDYDYHENKENWTMALDTNCKDRSYLFGRLLAVAYVLEKGTYTKGEDDNRQPNAIRLMNTFSRLPCKIWKILDERLNPYRAKLGSKAIRYDIIIQEVMSLFKSTEDFTSKKGLEGSYLLGFYCQKKDLYTSKPKMATEDSSEEDSSVDDE